MDSSTALTESHGATGRLRISRIVYRAGQFWLALFAVPGMEDLAAAQQVLSPPLATLFRGMQPSEQVHSLSVFRKLVEEERTQPDLLGAALLHDVGKCRVPLHLWERVLIVLCGVFSPKKLMEWGCGQPVGWKRAFVVAKQHPAWGAEMARQAGASPLTVALIRRHQEMAIRGSQDDPPDLEDQLLAYLQQFDDES